MRRIEFCFTISILLITGFFPSFESVSSYGLGGDNEANSIWFSDDIYPSFKYDERNSGLSPYNLSSNLGDLVWRFNTGNSIRSQVWMDANETSLVANTERLFEIDRNGVELMNISSPDNIWFMGMPIKDSDGNIYIGSVNRTVQHNQYPWYENSSFYSFHPNGTLRWEFRDNGCVSGNPIIHNNRIFFMSSSAALYCAYLNGTLDWKYHFNYTSGYYTSPAFDSEDNIYYVGEYDQSSGAIYSFTFNGTYRWHYDLHLPGPSPSIGMDDMIYINEGTILHSFFPNGTLNWKKWITPGNINDCVVHKKDGSLIVSSGYSIHSLYNNGTTNWTLMFESSIMSDLVISNDGYLVFKTADCILRVLTPDLKSHFTFKAGDYSHLTPIIARSGDIYIGMDDGYYYKIGRRVPSPPMNLTGSFEDGHVILRWEPPHEDGGIGIDEYSIFKGEDGSNESYFISVNGTNITYDDTDVINGRNYSYFVTSVNFVNESFPSETINGMPMGFADPPSLKRIWNDNGSVNFIWDPPIKSGGVEIIHYRLYRSLDNNTFYPIANIPSDTLTYSDRDVSPEITYYYQVLTKNKKGDGPRGSTIEIIHIRKPTPPMNLSGTIGDYFIDLSWEEPEEPGGIELTGFLLYKWRRGTTPVNITINAENRTYHDDDVENGIEYTFSIAAENEMGLSIPSNEINLTPMGVPNPPINLSVERIGNTLHLHWQPPGYDGGSSVIKYWVYVRMGNSTFGLEAEVGNDQLYYDFHGIVNNTVYEFYVTSTNDVGESLPSNVVVIKAVEFLVSVELLSASFVNGAIKIQWNYPDVEGITLQNGSDPGYKFAFFRLFRYNSSNEEISFFDTVWNDHIDREFSYGTSYIYHVTVFYYVYGALIEGPPSNEMMVIPATFPDPPTLVNSFARDGRVDFRWRPPDFDGGSPITGYQVFRKDAINGNWLFLSSTDSMVFFDEDIENGILYSYAVYSDNSVGLSLFPLEIDLLPLGVPTEPLQLRYTFEDGNLTLSWDAPEDDGGSDIKGYYLFRGSTLETLTHYSTLQDDQRVYYEEIVGEDVIYIRVAAYNDIGIGPPTEVVMINTTGDIDDNENDGSFTILIVIVVTLIIMVILILLWLVTKKNKYQYEE